MKRYLNIVIALALLMGAAATLQYLATGETSLYVLLLSPLALLPNITWRAFLGRVMTLFFGAAIVLLPIVYRRQMRNYLDTFIRWIRTKIVRISEGIRALWRVTPVWLRVFLGALIAIVLLVFAIFSGAVLLLISFFPVVVKTSMGFFVAEFLARTAAARGVAQFASVFWRAVPKSIRRWIEAHYRRLWWWTMRRIIRNRRRLERRLRWRRQVSP